MIKDDVRDGHLVRFDSELPLIKKFEPDFEITWAARVTKFNTDVSFYFLKAKKHVAQAFGFIQEIVLAYSDYPSLEARFMQAVDQFFQELPAKGRVDQTAAVILSASDNVDRWVKDYVAQNSQARAYVGISQNELLSQHEAWFLRNKMVAQLFSRDLFDYTLPLDSDLFFFGRQNLITEQIDAVRKSENRGIFGLRKTGKTSVLFKLMRQCDDNGILVKYYDCKLSPIYRMTGDQFLDRLALDVQQMVGVKVKGWKGKESAAERFLTLIEKIPTEKKICLIFDEIEYISPSSKLAPHWKDDFVPFWQAIWSTQSQFRKFSFIVAGVNAWISETDKIGGVQNPVFGIIRPKYLTGFEKEEVRSLLNVFGKRMGLNFDESAVAALYNRYGGHPLLTRMICSHINTGIKVKGQERPVRIDGQAVQKDLLSREEEIQFYCGHITSELEEFYPDEYALLELLAIENKADFIEMADEGEFVRHLKAYGLVDLSEHFNPEFKIPVIKSYVASKWRKRTSAKSHRYIVPLHRRDEFVLGRTSSILREIRAAEKKFKSLSLPDIYRGVGAAEAELFNSLKECAQKEDLIVFLNQCNRSLVEPIDRIGREIGVKDYFFGPIKSSYTKLWPNLNRIRAYRNKFLHLELNSSAQRQYEVYLAEDMDSKQPETVHDGWFQLQSAVLNGLLLGIQAELAKYD